MQSGVPSKSVKLNNMFGFVSWQDRRRRTRTSADDGFFSFKTSRYTSPQKRVLGGRWHNNPLNQCNIYIGGGFKCFYVRHIPPGEKENHLQTYLGKRIC